MTELITPLILSGGAGTRLWPLSTPERPKQFLNLHGEGTMIAQTIQRVNDENMFTSPIVLGSASHEGHLRTAISEAGEKTASIILEPCARNTAPAIALGAFYAGEDALLLVMPSDHVIRDNDAFLAALKRALPAAMSGHLVTFGIEPTGPDTGFGYIRAGEALGSAAGAFDVEAFIEKPDEARARAMLNEGGHCWNAGIFLFKSGVFLEELERHQPQVFAAAKAAIERASSWRNITSPQAEKFETSPSISVDYAVMELSDKVVVVPMSCGWSDLGSWDALAEIGEKDEAGNVIIGEVRVKDGFGNLIKTTGPRVSTIGMRDTIVVVSDEEVLIMPRGSSQRVKDFAP